MSASLLNPTKAWIFRAIHVDNLPWILQHGLHCRNSPQQDPGFINIGNAALIDKRARMAVPVPPYGTLRDYVPFYFTPWSVMMYNIHTGHSGIPKREKHSDLVFLR